MAAGRNAYAYSDGLRIAYEVRRSRWRRRPWMVLVQGLGFDRSGDVALRRLALAPPPVAALSGKEPS